MGPLQSKDYSSEVTDAAKFVVPDYYINISPERENQSSNSNNQTHEHEHENYRMSSKPLGMALIVNIEKYSKRFCRKALGDREGSRMDFERMSLLLKDLGYSVYDYENLSKKKLKEVVKEFRDLKDMEKVDSCIVVIMSHGKEMSSRNDVGLLCSDRRYLSSEWIVDQFSTGKCKPLATKPKVFFFQACRGTRKEYGMEVVVNSDSQLAIDSPIKIRTPTQADTLVIHPCLPGHVSIRDRYNGTWFIQELCDVFKRDSHKAHLEEMLKTVSRNLKKKFSNLYGIQVLNITNFGFDKNMYFNQSSMLSPMFLFDLSHGPIFLPTVIT